MSDYVELSAKHVAVRKPRICEWCAEWVMAGEQALYRAYKNDGDFRTEYMHLECEQAMNKMPHEDLYEGWNRGDFKRGTTDGTY